MIRQKRLTKRQYELLEAVGIHRFVTTQLLGEYMKKDSSTLYERLSLLVIRGYLHKTYDSRYRLLGKPAVYSLSAQGISAVRTHGTDLPPSTLKNQYKNAQVRPVVIDRALTLFTIENALLGQYGDDLRILTKQVLGAYDAFLSPFPDLYLQFKSSLKEGKIRHYQLEHVDPKTMQWIVYRRMVAHREWYEENDGDSDWELNGRYPGLLFVCENDRMQKQIALSARSLDVDFDIFTTTYDRLSSLEMNIWQDALGDAEEEEETALRGL